MGDTVEELKSELELVKASKRSDRDSSREAKELAAALDNTRLALSATLLERDLVIASLATWRSRALELGWKEEKAGD